MQYRGLVLLCVSLLIVGAAAPMAVGGDTIVEPGHELTCEYPMTLTDATGEDVTLDEPPERVVTLAPSAAQTVWAIGAEDRVVGMTAHGQYLEGADEREVITDEDGWISPERVIDAEPDLVLAPDVISDQTIDQLREAGLTVYHFEEVTSMDAVITEVELIGQLLDACEEATETADWMHDRITFVEDAVADEDRPSILYVHSQEWTAGEQTHIDDMITIAGGENTATEAGIEGHQPISEEVVIDEDPEWIILNSAEPDLPETGGFTETTAAEEDQIIVVNIEHISQPAPGNIHAIEEIAEQLHPEAYAEAQADDTDETDATDDTDQTDETDDADDQDAQTMDDGTDEEDDSIPAFGPVAAAIALIVGALGWRLRH